MTINIFVLKGDQNGETRSGAFLFLPGICDTPSSEYAVTHQIWNSYLKEYRRYAPDSMQFLLTRSEVKCEVKVTRLWYATLLLYKMHPHTKFEIPTSNNIRDMFRTRLF